MLLTHCWEGRAGKEKKARKGEDQEKEKACRRRRQQEGDGQVMARRRRRPRDLERWEIGECQEKGITRSLRSVGELECQEKENAR